VLIPWFIFIDENSDFFSEQGDINETKEDENRFLLGRLIS